MWFGAVTRPATTLASLAATTLYLFADAAAESLLTVAHPPGVDVAVTSPTDLGRYRAAVKIALVAIPALAWLVASLWAGRRAEHRRAGLVHLAGFMLPIAAISSAACAFRIRTFHALTADLPRELRPTLAVSSLDHAWWALGGAIVAALALAFAVRRR